MPQGARSLSALVLLLLVVTPLAWAITEETWTDGIYDYESDAGLQVTAHESVAVVHSRPALSFDGILVAVGRLVVADRVVDIAVIPSASQTRAPPPS